MIRNCNNCAGRLRYSIEKKALLCDSCGSTFDVGAKQNYKAASVFECNEYRCGACGAKVLVNDTEASTFCIYCGSGNVVFERVNTESAPKKIVPFEITRKVAAQKVRSLIEQSKWVPGSVKRFSESQLTAVYVPYYKTKVEYDGSVISGANNGMPWQLNGYGGLTVVTDAVHKLDDDTMAGIEPFRLEAAKDFDPDYLLGFHSNVPDIVLDVALYRAKEKAVKVANSLYKKEIAVKGYAPVRNDRARRDTTVIYEEPEIILLPVWFLTMKHDGEVYTILINGQTGKLTGMLPGDGRKIRLVRNLIALPIILLALVLGIGCASFAIFTTSYLDDAVIFLICQLVFSVFAAGLSYATLWYRKKLFTEAEVQSRDRLLSVFANRRQKGE